MPAPMMLMIWLAPEPAGCEKEKTCFISVAQYGREPRVNMILQDLQEKLYLVCGLQKHKRWRLSVAVLCLEGPLALLCALQDIEDLIGPREHNGMAQ